MSSTGISVTMTDEMKVTGLIRRRKFLISYFFVLIATLRPGSAALGQGAAGPATEQASIVSFAQSGISRALNYAQGDGQSLVDAKDDFSAAGWIEFMKRMDGWLDDSVGPETDN